jgi:hypothetical protein
MCVYACVHVPVCVRPCVRVHVGVLSLFVCVCARTLAVVACGGSQQTMYGACACVCVCVRAHVCVWRGVVE